MSVDRYSVAVKRSDHPEWLAGTVRGRSDRQPEAIHGDANAAAGPIHLTTAQAR
jgi:hypothetical protein